MYHVKDDKRSKKSAEMIYEALVKLIDVKPFERITISEVLRKSTISRATFYRNFDELSDVLRMKCDMQFQEYWRTFNEKYSDDEPEGKALLIHYYSYWYNHREILMVLAKIGRPDIACESIIKFEYIFAKRFLPLMDLDSVAYQYYIAGVGGELSQTLITWCKNGMKETPEEMVEFIWEYKKIEADIGFTV